MFALSQVAIGLGLMHAFWLFFFIVGSLTVGRAPTSGSVDRRAGGSLVELVTASAAGIAITGLFGFMAGLAGLLHTWSLLVLIALLLTLAQLRGARVFGSRFWRDRVAVIAGAFSWQSGIIYCLGVVIAVPAILPEVATDPNMLHLPYALEWAQAHSLTVDPNLRFPYYVMNWQLLYSWLFLLGLGNWTPILSALCGVLTGLGIQAALSSRVPYHDGNDSPTAIGSFLLVAAPLMLFLSPTFLRWDVTSMIDIPIAFMFLATALLATKALERGADGETLVRLIVCAGFFVGLKPSFFMFAPVLAVLVWLAAKATGRGAAAAVLLLFVIASPWYVKNFVQDGDPITPYLNLAIAHRDAKFSAWDWDQITKDLISKRDTLSLIKLPARIFLHPNTDRFREYGVTFALIGIYLPLVFLWLVLILQNKTFLSDRRLLVFSTLASYGVLYWIATSYLARYSLLFTPELCVCIALWLVYLSRRGRVAAVAAVGLGLACMIPTPSSGDWFSHWALSNYEFLPAQYKSREDYLDRNLVAYREGEFVSQFEIAPGRAKRVLALCCPELAYRFKLHGITLIGDWVGPARYFDLAIAIHQNRLAYYIEHWRIDAIVARRGYFFSPHEIDELVAEAKKSGFTLGPVFDKENVVLLKETENPK